MTLGSWKKKRPITGNVTWFSEQGMTQQITVEVTLFPSFVSFTVTNKNAYLLKTPKPSRKRPSVLIGSDSSEQKSNVSKTVSVPSCH